MCVCVCVCLRVNNNNITITHYIEYNEGLSLSIGVSYPMNWIHVWLCGNICLSSHPFYLRHLDARGLFMFYMWVAVISVSCRVAFLLFVSSGHS